MASTFTPNIQLEEPARGDDIGVWDTPVNSNMSLLDLAIGNAATINLNNSPVILNAAQFQSKGLTFASTLTGNVTITFPSSFTKSYEIFNECSGSSAFVITLKTTVAGAQQVCAPPGELVSIANIGGNLFYSNLGRIGSLMEYAGSSVPAWITNCSLPPYLNCDGTAFNTTNYPTLAIILNAATLPDIRGTTRYTLNQGTGRLTTANGGLDGNTNFSLKTAQATLGTSNLPAYTPSGTLSINQAAAFTQVGLNFTATAMGSGGNSCYSPQAINGANNLGLSGSLSGTIVGAAQGGVSNVLPVGTATVVGITMIRAG